VASPSITTTPVADAPGPTKARTITLVICALVLLAAIVGLVQARSAYVGATRSVTFTSAAGGTLELTRQKKGAFYSADCRIGP
jgi:hypothetical protein